MKRIVVLLLFFLLPAPAAWAQRTKAAPKFDARKNAAEQKELARKAADSREELLVLTKKYRDSLEGVLTALQEQERLIAETLAKKRPLVQQGLLARRELEQQELELARVQEQMKSTTNSITQADQFRVEILNLEQLAKNPPKAYSAPGAYYDNLRYIRYTGVAAWSLRGYGEIEAFFQARFRQALPVSAFGQSETHSRLGFDHSQAFDVALHPDSAEAQELMSFLRSRGIPFTAFRGAIPGNATGAHIHIGAPSHRFR